MPAYAIANIQSITMGPELAEYLELIDATLAPYDGRFLVHAPTNESARRSEPKPHIPAK